MTQWECSLSFTINVKKLNIWKNL